MKISDLQSYQTPQIISKKKNSREKTKLSAINSIGQKVVDVAISSTIRFLVFIALFKLAMTMVPKNIIQEIALAVTPVEKFAVASIHGIDKLAIYSLIFAFFCGTFYYVFMVSKCEFGTIGMKLTKLGIANRNGERPNIVQAIIWYHLRIIYPVCGVLSVIVFTKYGINGTFVILLLLAAMFSDTPRIIFGIPSLSEKISGVKLFEKQ
jgi:uncharacterized RDD family membrane protein YckC